MEQQHAAASVISGNVRQTPAEPEPVARNTAQTQYWRRALMANGTGAASEQVLDAVDELAHQSGELSSELGVFVSKV